jgi:hypothetical protein
MLLDWLSLLSGGWNGTRRLNDLWCLDEPTLTWSLVEPRGIPAHVPLPRAGATLSVMRGGLLLFGGSGNATKCFNDTIMFDIGKEGLK